MDKKSKQICVFTTPSIMDDMKKIAHMKELSVNHTLNLAFQEYIEQNQSLIQQYDKWKGEIANGHNT